MWFYEKSYLKVLHKAKWEYIQSNLKQVDTKKKRHLVYEEKDQQDEAKYAAQCGTTADI